jgi:putative endonuclease
MHYLYIIYSRSADKYYVGVTGNVKQRLDQHNNSERDTFTSKYRPWELLAVYSCKDMSTARTIESFIKRQKSRNLLRRLASNEPLTGLLAQLVRVPNLELFLSEQAVEN